MNKKTQNQPTQNPLMIDLLKICYTIEDHYFIDTLQEMKAGETFDFCEFYLYKIEGKYFENVFQIRYDYLGEPHTIGELKFGLIGGKNVQNLAWIWVQNRSLYNGDFYYLEYISSILGLAFKKITAIDFCLDSDFNVAKYLKSLIKNREVTTILNGKRAINRNIDRPEISYNSSGSLNSPDKYLSTYVKSKKAIKDKSKGSSLISYDKISEINNSSGKDYITDFYDNPKKLYRTEIHLNNEAITNYVLNFGCEIEELLYDYSLWNT